MSLNVDTVWSRVKRSSFWTAPGQTILNKLRQVQSSRHHPLLPMSNDERAAMTLSCRDCDPVPKVADAGHVRVEDGRQIQVMHNGIKVIAGGYMGDWTTRIIEGLHGHHEPQEELVFHHLLKHVRPGTVMTELGSNWAYYTLWYLHDVAGSRALCIEPDPTYMAVGVANAKLNSATDRITFRQGWVGGSGQDTQSIAIESSHEPLTLPNYDMARVLDAAGGGPIELVHIDAQGAELPFLRSMAAAVGRGQVRFLVMSTHHSSISGSETTHGDCVREIKSLGGTVLVEHSVQTSYSGDGLVVASFDAGDRTLSLPAISRNDPKRSLFPKP